ncbi:hypothetical protein TNCV_1201401 [Trichonephila clavipes]|nr:hypothetical protein TNCV_1201401 [Trichonephila clavipes]
MRVRVYEDQALSTKCVYEWFARFRECRVWVSDNSRSERPFTSVKDKNIEKLDCGLKVDPKPKLCWDPRQRESRPKSQAGNRVVSTGSPLDP